MSSATAAKFIGLGPNGIPRPPFSPADIYSLALLTFKSMPLLLPVVAKINAPHGRFAIESRFNINGNFGWFLMEVVSPLTFLISVSSAPLSSTPISNPLSLIRSLVSSASFERFLSLPSTNQLLAILFVTHYLHRAVLQPLRSPLRSPMHPSVPLSAVFFNVINGFLMGSWIGGRTGQADAPLVAASATGASAQSWIAQILRWLAGLLGLTFGSEKVSSSGIAGTPATLGLVPSSAWSNPLWYLGLAGCAIGFASNVWHDERLMDLRRPGAVADHAVEASDQDRKPDATGQKSDGQNQKRKPAYMIPYGGLYRFISFPNYLSEWFEWSSFALAALHHLPCALPSISDSSSPSLSLLSAIFSSPPALFALVEVCVMLPRAVNGHAWYRTRFGVEGDGKGGRYPRSRKAVLPGLL